MVFVQVCDTGPYRDPEEILAQRGVAVHDARDLWADRYATLIAE